MNGMITDRVVVAVARLSAPKRRRFFVKSQLLYYTEFTMGQIGETPQMCYHRPVIQLLLATHNRGKLAEFSSLLRDLPIQVVGAGDLGLLVPVEESGATYGENAQLKAEALLHASGLPTLGDDSGLEVDALNGAPGLHSARYAGHGASDRDRWQLLLARLAGVPWQKRTARFRCVLALAVPGGATHTVEGTCEGFIALEPRGEKGFGYDPVFFLPGQQCTMAQLTSEAKNQISHRANAVRALRRILESYVAAGGLMSARQAPVPKAEEWDA